MEGKEEFLLNTNTISPTEFIHKYIPINNNCAPSPLLGDIFGLVAWDYRDLDKIQIYLQWNRIWSIFEFDDMYLVRPGLWENKTILRGYIVTENPYRKDFMDVVIINKT